MPKKKQMQKKNYLKLFTISFVLISLGVSVYLINLKTHFLNYANFEKSARPANITVDFSKSTPYVRNWRFLAQGGESPKDSLATIVDPIRKLEPAYIRIDHVFDFYSIVTRNSGGELEFDFSRLDRELNAIRSMGAKPFISLSYMPPAISQGSEVDFPVNWFEWEMVVRKTIEHISGKGELGTRDVYYEVWNEPDLFGKFTINGAKNYLDLYYYAARGAANANDTYNFKFGGPAITNPMKNWITSLLQYCESKNLRLDFLSWHRYSKEITDFEVDVKNVEEWRGGYPKFSNVELIISEAGINSEIDKAYDETVSGIHTMQIATSLLSKNVKIFNFEIKDGVGPTKYWGRWGILTNGMFGIPEEKPRYHAFTFLNQMTGEKSAVYGEGSNVRAFAVVDQKNKIYKLLMSNYDRYGNHVENVPITLNGLPGNSFKLKQIDYMGKETVKNVESLGNSWSTSIFMQANSATIIELSNFK